MSRFLSRFFVEPGDRSALFVKKDEQTKKEERASLGAADQRRRLAGRNSGTPEMKPREDSSRPSSSLYIQKHSDNTVEESSKTSAYDPSRGTGMVALGSHGQAYNTRLNFIERLYPDAYSFICSPDNLDANSHTPSTPRRTDLKMDWRDALSLSDTSPVPRSSASYASDARERRRDSRVSMWKMFNFDVPDRDDVAAPLKLQNTHKSMTQLECLVKCLSGALVKHQSNGIRHTNLIWVDKLLQTLSFNEDGRTRRIAVEDIDEIKSSGSTELKIRAEDQKLVFQFQSKDFCDSFFTGLCLLVSKECTVKYNARDLHDIASYNPFLDTYNRKPVYKKKRFGDYVLLKGIGRGAFGKVYVALHRKERLFYAVKAVKRKVQLSQDFRMKAFGDSFQMSKSSGSNERETKVMQIIDHKNVVSLIDIIEDEERNRLLIVCELMPNGALMSTDDLRTVSPMGDDVLVRKVFVDALNGLEYLHKNNIVHRDIKPDNLLTQPDGLVKLSDFGTSKIYEDDMQKGKETAVGTPAFCAPEHCASMYAPPPEETSYTSDIWSLGATLFFLVFGKLPFQKRNVFETYDAICREELKFPETPKVSRELKVLITSMMRKQPGKRASVDALKSCEWLQQGSRGL